MMRGLVCLAAALLFPGAGMTTCGFVTNKTQTLAGTLLTYQITITNTTGSGIRGLYVIDTVSPALLFQTSDAPAQFGTATVYGTASGTVYTWSYDLGGSGKAILSKDEVWTFTITGQLPDSCALLGIANTAQFQIAGSGCSAFDAAPQNTVASTANLTVVKIQSPPAPPAGSPITYTIVVTNAGTTTLTSLFVNDTISTAILGVVQDGPPGFSATGPVSTGGGNWFGWRDTGALIFSPGADLTFTATGTVAGTCVSTEISNTAFAAAMTTGCGASATEMISNVTSFTIPTPPAGITVTQTQLGGLFSGDPVTYRIVVENTGSATLLSLTVVDTVPGEIVGQAADQPAALGAPLVAQVAGGTRYVWSATGLTLSPTGSFTFTITGAIGFVCAPTAVSATVFAVGGAFCGQDAVFSNPVGSDLLPPAAAGLSVSQLQLGGGSAGAPLSYRIVVTNSGAITIANLTVTDTVAALLVGQTTAQPAEMGAPTLTAVAPSGSRYVWSAAAMPTGLLPGRSFTFTVSGLVGITCASVVVTNTAYLEASAGCSSTLLFTAVTGSVINPPAATLSVVQTLSPASPVSGGPVTYRIVVTNLGTATLATLTVTDTVEAAITAAAATTPPGWAAATLTPVAPTGSLFAWSNATLTFGPGATLTFTITGIAGVCVPNVVSNTAYVTGTSACAFAEAVSNATGFRIGAVLAAAASAPKVATVNQAFAVVLTVTNTGDDAADNVLPELAVGPGAGLTSPLTGPVPPGPLSLAPGASQSFTWTFSAVGGGVATFTATAAGDSCGGAAVLAAAGVSCTLQSPPALAASIVMFPSPRDTAQTFLVTLTITNAGQATASGVDVAGFLATGTGAATLAAGPTPALPADILGGRKATFTWTFTGTAPGTVLLSTTVSGTDFNTGLPIPDSLALSNTELIQTPAALEGAATLVPAQVSTGQWFTLALTVTNTGQAAAQLVTPALVNTSGAAMNLRSGPVPAGPLTLAGGAAQTFRWTYSPDGFGPLFFSLSAAGFDANNGARVFTGRTITGLVQIRAALTAGLALSATSVGPGGAFAVRLTVTNTGQAAATGLRPPVLAVAGFGSATVAAAGWPPAGPFTLAGGAALTWTYTFTAGGAGTLSLSGLVAGVDGNAGWAVTAAAGSPPLQVGAPQFTILSLVAGPASLGLDQLVTLVLTASNTGRFVLDHLAPGAVAVTGDGRLAPETGPQPGSVSGVTPGETVTFTWTLRTLRGGTVTLTAGLSADQAPPPPPATSNPVRIVEAGGSLADAVVYPTPFDPDAALGGVLKFRKMPPFSTASIFTNAGELVRTLTADHNGTVGWDGRNDAGSRVFPGIYFYLLKSPAGEKKRGKFEVAN